jgi:hypothetical protein
MALFELEKDGKTFEVEAPDQAAALKALPQFQGAAAPKQPRGVVDKLLGLTGERYQTWPERAVREAAGVPQKYMDAVANAPQDPKGFGEAVAGPGLEAAAVFTPLGPGLKAAKAATGGVAPSLEEITAASNAGYSAARSAGVVIEPKAVADLSSDLTKELTKAGYRDYLAPKTFRAIEELKALENPTYEDVESVRQLLNRAAADPLEKDAVRRAIDGLDGFVEGLSEDSVISGDASQLSKVAGEARGNWSAKKRSETIQDALEKAERQAGSAHSGANTDNAIRQQIKSIRNNPKKSRGYTEEELAKMDEIIHGSTGGNMLRTGGNLLGGGGGLGAALTAGGGALAAGPLGAAAPLVGYGLKQAGAASTRRQVDELLEMIRRRSPVAEERGVTEMPQAAIQDPNIAANTGRAGAAALSSPLAQPTQ